MEEAMLGIAGGAASVTVAADATKAITPEVAHLAQSVASNIPVVHDASGFLTTPGDGMSQGISMAKA